MTRHAALRFGVASRGNGMQAGDEGELALGDRRRAPAQLPDRQITLAVCRRGADQTSIDLLEASGMTHARTDAVEPATLVGRLRRRERRTGNLFGVEAVVHLLRRIAADRQ